MPFVPDQPMSGRFVPDNAAQPLIQPQRQSFMSQVGRTAGLGARSIYNSLAAIPNMVHDIPAAISNDFNRTFYPEGYDVTINGQKEHRTGILPLASSAQNEAMSDLGLSTPETTQEKIGDFATQVIAGFPTGRPINAAVSALAGLKSVPAATRAASPAQGVLERAGREGMVVPPAQVAPRSAGALLEGMGGTLKTGQQAAAKNQPIINSLAARAVGVTDEALTPETLQAIRNKAGDAYRVIRQAGTIATDAEYVTQIKNAVEPFKTAAQSFESLANAPLVAMSDDLAKQSFDADSAVSAIKMLRDKASVAYRAGSNQEGAAYRSMASAMEDMIERHLTSKVSAGKEILKAFRDARQLIAKTHTVEDALRGSNVDINALGRMLKSGVPMTEELKLLGQFSQHYPGAANLTQALKARPPYSPLDWIASLSSIGAAGATGNAALSIPAAYSIARPAARLLALSPMVQNTLRRRQPTTFPGPWRLGSVGAAPAVGTAVRNQQQQQQ